MKSRSNSSPHGRTLFFVTSMPLHDLTGYTQRLWIVAIIPLCAVCAEEAGLFFSLEADGSSPSLVCVSRRKSLSCGGTGG